ncbi:uncharacterized protein LOC144342944, partial [Saccoglossus kowalevskii]
MYISVLVMCVVTSSTAVTVIVPGSPVTSIETTTTVLECTFMTTGNNPHIIWYKGSSTYSGNLILQAQNGVVYAEPGFTRHGIQDECSLVITDTKMSDAGMYWCYVSVFGDGSDEKSLTLTVS